MTNHAPPLPLPEPRQWMTRTAAAELLGVSVRTVDRFIDGGTLKHYRPQHGRAEQSPVLLWARDVEDLNEARRRIARRYA